jgi:hypothetical protein
MLQTATTKAAVATQVGALSVIDSMQERLARASNAEGIGAYLRYRVWIILIGILVVAAAAGFAYCQARGHNGFTGNIEAIKGPLGVKIGVKIECF